MNREEARKRIESRLRYYCGRGGARDDCSSCWCYPCGDIEALESLKEQKPRGEWEHWGSPFTDDTIANSIVCSLCKARYVKIEGEVFNYCPNCGAPMNEGAFRKYNGLKKDKEVSKYEKPNKLKNFGNW